MIGNFSSKCTYTKQDENEEKETSKFKKGKLGNKKKRYEKRKIVYTIEDSEDSDGSEVEETEVLFMGLDTQASISDLDVEGEVDLRVELVSALEELDKCSKKNTFKSYHQLVGSSTSRSQKDWGGPKPTGQRKNTGVWKTFRRDHAI